MNANEEPGHKLAKAAHDLIGQARFDLAWRAVELAIEVTPGFANSYALKAHLLERRGEFDAALGLWREAARLEPASAGHRFNLALALLCAGEFAEGFALQDARLEKADWNSIAAQGSFAGLRHYVPRPRDSLAGKRVLAFTEQGLGDMLWAARYLPALAARCGRLDLACPPSLRPLLEARVGGEVLGPPAETPGAKLNMAALAGAYDALVPMMSLPHLLGDPLGESAGEAPWLRPDAAAVAAWRERYAALPGAGPVVGVVWRANPASGTAAVRSLPPGVLAGMAGMAGMRVVNLQGGAAEGRDAMSAALPGVFDPLAAGDVALDAYAAMVAATDLLISVDTMAAHLAGSMGHPVWVAVPGVPSFYMGQAGAVSPWYPTMRLFRQAPGEEGWEGVGRAIVGALRGR